MSGIHFWYKEGCGIEVVSVSWKEINLKRLQLVPFTTYGEEIIWKTQVYSVNDTDCRYSANNVNGPSKPDTDLQKDVYNVSVRVKSVIVTNSKGRRT